MIKSFKEKISDAIGPMIGFMFILIFCFFSLKGCIVTVWKSPENLAAYEIVGADNRELLMIFFPKNEVMLVAKDHNKREQAILTRMRGTYGTHYIGNIWNVDGPNSGFLFGLKWAEEDAKPVHMEIKIIKKYNPANLDSTFGDVGTYHQTLYFKENAVKYHGMWLRKVEFPKHEAELIRSSFFGKR